MLFYDIQINTAVKPKETIKNKNRKRLFSPQKTLQILLRNKAKSALC
jgi:hypothetical protein